MAFAYFALAAVLLVDAASGICTAAGSICEEEDAELLSVELLQQKFVTKMDTIERLSQDHDTSHVEAGKIYFSLGREDFARAEELIPKRLQAAGLLMTEFVPRFLIIANATGAELQSDPKDADFPLHFHYELKREPLQQHAKESLKPRHISHQTGSLDTLRAEVAEAFRAAARSNPLYKLLNGFDLKSVETAVSSLTSGHIFPTDLGHGTSVHPAISAYNPEGRCGTESGSARLKAAQDVDGPILRLFQAQARIRAWIWRAGEQRPINPAADQELKTTRLLHVPFNLTWDRVSKALAMFAMLPAFVSVDNDNHTTFLNSIALSSCWEASPFFYGPMIFKYNEVFQRLTDPKQARGFYAATAPGSTKYFGRNNIIFTDGQTHRKYRHLLDAAGYARRYPIDAELVRQITARGEDTASIVSAVAPVLFKGLWGAAPGEDIMKAIQTYGSLGKFAIFGKHIDEIFSPAGITQKIMDARKSLRDWAAAAPFVQVLLAARAEFFPDDSFFRDTLRLVEDVSDVSALTGLLGTTDMVQKCVKNQRKDPSHQELFRANPERYLIELMRLDSAVTSVTELLRKDQAFILEGRNLTLGRFTPTQLVLATANRDPVHFTDPTQFDLWRENLGDSVAWNGRSQDVEARDEEKAPRGCPGHCLSIKVGAAVCAEMMGSFEELLQAGKVGGEIRCNNFEHKDGKGDHAPLWTPSNLAKAADPRLSWILQWHPAKPPPGADLVRAFASCGAKSIYLGKYDTLAECTAAVEDAGGKYFDYGRGFVRAGWCHLVYTQSRECPEGFEKSMYDFFDIPIIPDSQWLRCQVDLASLQIFSKGELAGKGLLSKEEYTYPKSAELTSVVKMSKRHFHGTQTCLVEHHMQCLAETARIYELESCCNSPPWGEPCKVTEALEPTDVAEVLDDSITSWWQLWEDDFVKFAVEAPTDPPLPNIKHPALHLSVVSRSITRRQIFDTCPLWVKVTLQVLGDKTASHNYILGHAPNGDSERDRAIAKLLGETLETATVLPPVFDAYTLGMTSLVIHALENTEGEKVPLHKRFALPGRQAISDSLAVMSFLRSPVRDIDWGLEPYLDMVSGCVLDAFHSFPIEDGLESGGNEWWRITVCDDSNVTEMPNYCSGGKSPCLKHDFIRGLFASHDTGDGKPVYPDKYWEMRKWRLSGEAWSDIVETYIALYGVASHMLEVPEDPPVRPPTEDGDAIFYAVKTLDIAGLATRPGFATPGADLYLSKEGRPVMIDTPHGQHIWRSQVDASTWEYWKFHWRSSVYLRVTIFDHLYATHFGMAGMLAAAAREALPAEHPLRRLISVFTWNTIQANNEVLQNFASPRTLLHRSTPFQDWQEVMQLAKARNPSFKKRFQHFFGANLSHPNLGFFPYYEDGSQLAHIIHELVDDWLHVHIPGWSYGPGHCRVEDPKVELFLNRLASWTLEQDYAEDIEWFGLFDSEGDITCTGLSRYLSVLFFGVTGFHRHVGHVSDLAADPELASSAWRLGESSGLPRQQVLMALTVALMLKEQPKLDENYGFMAHGIQRESESTYVLRTFQAKLLELAKVIERRNSVEELHYFSMHPMEVEISVAA